MTIIGSPSHWAGMLGSQVPEILALVVATWEKPAIQPRDTMEDSVTLALCWSLLQQRDARESQFRIIPQVVELDPLAATIRGRMDIIFFPRDGDESIYFCLECKRLNVVHHGRVRSEASQYVAEGMLRFVSGKYARAVHDGGMLGYVLNGDIPRDGQR